MGPSKEALKAKGLEEMQRYCEEDTECRRAFLLRALGETQPAAAAAAAICNAQCDNCWRRQNSRIEVWQERPLALYYGLFACAPFFAFFFVFYSSTSPPLFPFSVHICPIVLLPAALMMFSLLNVVAVFACNSSLLPLSVPHLLANSLFHVTFLLRLFLCTH